MTRLRITWALARVWLALKFARWAELLLDAPKPKRERVYQLDGNRATPLSEVQVIYARRLPTTEAAWLIRVSMWRESAKQEEGQC